ncbi:hypothetical protein J2X17_000705 [Flavobacterium aquidurense]|nr:hypothetical protein [Flavobacterium aquidurense]
MRLLYFVDHLSDFPILFRVLTVLIQKIKKAADL